MSETQKHINWAHCPLSNVYSSFTKCYSVLAFIGELYMLTFVVNNLLAMSEKFVKEWMNNDYAVSERNIEIAQLYMMPLWRTMPEQ